MRIKRLCEQAHEDSRKNGWYDTEDNQPRNAGEMMMLMVSEIGEMMEAWRKRAPGGEIKPSEKIPEFSLLEEEAADLAIRLGDFCQYHGIRLEDAISAKMGFNRTRGWRHGGLKC